MADDPEKQLLQGLADHDERIKKLEEEVNDLTNKVEDLTDKIVQIETSGFQEQLNALNDRINKLDSILLGTRRFLAAHDIEQLRMFLMTWLGSNKITNIEVDFFLNSTSAAAKQATLTSLTPIDVADDFRDRCVAYFKAHGYSAFLEY